LEEMAKGDKNTKKAESKKHENKEEKPVSKV
jgi:hypothetical protein